MLPYGNDAKIAKIRNLWTFWLVIQRMNHLFKIGHKAFFLSDFKKMAYFAISASFLYGNLKCLRDYFELIQST